MMPSRAIRPSLKRRVAPAALTILVALIAGCVSIGGKPATSRYYALDSALRDTTRAGADTLAAGPLVGIRPVSIPGSLDRPQIVTRPSEREVRIAEFDRWAEPLGAAVPRVIAENLSVFVPTDRVVVFPWKSSLELDYEVDLRILEFSLQPDGNVELVARWSVLDKGQGRRSAVFLSSFERPASDTDYDSIVGAMTAVLEELSREIAAEIRSAS